MSTTTLTLDNKELQSNSLSLDNNESLSTIVKLVSKDSVSFECTFKEIQCSKLLITAFNDLKNDNQNDIDNNCINLTNIDGEILKYIVEFLKHHNGEEPPLPEKPVKSKDMKEITNEWMAEFIDNIVKKDIHILYKVISASNYLFINSLLHICCAKIASMIKGIPIDKIKNTLLTYKDKDVEEEKSNTDC